MSLAAQVRRLSADVGRLEAARMPPAPPDPVLIARAIGLVLDPWQERVLRSTAQTLLLNCSRQVGKSSMVAVLIIATLLQPERTVVIVSPSERQSKELHRKVLTIWRKIGRPVAHTAATRTSLELANHSRLEALPANEATIRGISAVDLLVAEEAAMVDEALFNSVSPMLSVSNGRLLAPSTPKGRRGWWYSLWTMLDADDPDIERIQITAEECPRIGSRFLERERRRIGPWWFDQEYMCVFQEGQTQAFTREEVERAFREGVEPWEL